MPKKKNNEKAKNLTLTWPAGTRDKVDSRRGTNCSVSAQIINDIELFWSVCRYGLKTAHAKLGKQQAKLILDAQKGTAIDPNTLWMWLARPYGLQRQVRDSIELDGADKASTIEAISELTEIEMIAVLDWAKTFWNNEDTNINAAVENFKEDDHVKKK